MSIDATVKRRLEDWRDKLIDLSRANRLLAFRSRSGSAVRVVEEDPREIAEHVLAGRTLTFDPRLPDGDTRPAGTLRTGDQRLQTDLEAERLHKVLLRLHRESRASLEEQGFNTLYLALGALGFQTPDDPRPFHAPLLLLPVELHRRGARADFRLKAYDDDPQVNPALLLKLRQDLGVEVALPGEDEPLTYEAVRAAFVAAVAAVAGRADAEVTDGIHLGLFSFAKIPLYNDLLEHGEAIGTHAIAASLARGEAPPDADPAPLPTAEEVEARMDPTSTFQILDADSSQQAAILAAREGRSFVLQGPPGTGKSQTIANIIAEALATDRTVLFVSEKMAALEVVQRRLEAAGLGAFCLELHSRKANKREVVQSLAHAWAQWSQTAGRTEGALLELRELRETLAGYIQALHEPRGAAGYAAFEMLGQTARYRPVPACPFELPEPLALDRPRLKTVEQTLRQLTPLRRAVEPVAAHPWHGVRRCSLGVETLDDARRNLNLHLGALEALRRQAEGIDGLLGAGQAATTAGAARERAVFGRRLLGTTRPPPAWVADREWSGLSPRVAGALAAGRELADLGKGPLAAYEPGALELEAAALQVRARPGGWLLGWWRRRGVRKLLGALRRPGAGRPDLQADLGALARARVLRDQVRDGDGALLAAFGGAYAGPEGDFEALQAHCAWIRDLHAHWPAGVEAGDAVALLVGGEGHEGLRKALDDFDRADGEATTRREELRAHLDLDASTAWPAGAEHAPFDALVDQAETWLERLNDLPAWMAWAGARAAASADGLTAYLDAFDGRSLSSGALLDGWFRTWWAACADEVLQSVDVLRAFDGRLHEGRVDRFRRLDKDQQALARERIAEKLRAAVPHPNVRSVGDSEVGLLKREIGKQRRHLPTRVLLDRIPQLLHALKPCLMMSPLSVATYLPPGRRPFDLVVFDEASQICTEDGVGAIARGNCVVVAGDSKQLPPTRFFERRIDEDDEAPEDLLVDLPSILDECKAGPLPQIPLKWHYRSRDESLITFSNHYFYEDSLVTFPNAARDADQLGISFERVPDGVYHPGPKGSRSNPIEAAAVAARVFEILRTRPEDSVGVVTFSTTQRDAVLDALDALRTDGDEYAERFDGDALEPVFVKNLESVQGDERDVILFSVGYGPDPEGVLRLNFGPLNKEGGDRRLNVAVTRARKQVVVYSSIDPEAIDSERAKGRGARLLRAYLETARRGMAPPVLSGDAEAADPLVESVRRELSARGFEVDVGVGNSEFKVDLAVRHPEHPGRYVLAILCDGPAYARAATSRDRERTRCEALERLGWTVHRLWAPDWVRAPGRELDRIASAVEGARERQAADAVPAPVPASAAESAVAPLEVQAPRFEEEPELPGVVDYRPAGLRPRGPAAEFHVAPLGRLVTALKRVVEREGPLHADLAARRLATAWGITRSTAKVVRRFEEAADQLVREGDAERRGAFLYPPGLDEFAVRRPAGGVQRDLEEVPPEELAAAVELVVESYLGLSRESLVREVARAFGHQRLTDKVAETLDPVLADLVAAGRVRADGERFARVVPEASAPDESAIEPPATGPPATEPPATEPPATGPPATGPPAP